MGQEQGSKWFGNAGAVAIALVMSLLLGELALRVIGFSYHLYPEKIEFGWPDPVTLEDKFEPDPDLFWVPKGYAAVLASARAKPPRLIFMGDSCTQYGRYDTHLAAIFQQKTGRPLEFANIGTGGWTSYQGRQQLERDVVPLAPKVVTLYYGWNDHWVGFGIADKDIARVKSSPVRFFERLRLGQIVSKAFVVVLHRRRSGEVRRVSPDDYRRNLESMIDLARAHGITPVLITAPSSHVAGKEPANLQGRFLTDLTELVPLHRQYNDIVREVARDKQAALADLAEAFEGFAPDLLAYSYFNQDGIHLRDGGNRQIAELLYACFEREGLVEALE